MQDSFSYLVSKPETYWISLLLRLLVTVFLTDVAAPRVETLTIQVSPPSQPFRSSASVNRSTELMSVEVAR